MNFRKFFQKGKVFTVPNIMTMFRILLVPAIIWAFLGLKSDVAAIVLLAVSALTDVLDGIIARKFNMVSDLGKALDPIADKLTQVSVVLCLAFRYKLMWILLGLCVFRETCMFIMGLITIKKTDSVYSARWFGKISTVMLYGTMLALLVFPGMPKRLSVGLIVLCMLLVVMALFLYARFYLKIWKTVSEDDSAELPQEEAG